MFDMWEMSKIKTNANQGWSNSREEKKMEYKMEHKLM